MSATIYTGNGTSQSIDNGLDMSTGDFGGLVILKSRDDIRRHMWEDTVRGATKYISSNLTNAEATGAQTVTSFDTTGVTVGTDGDCNNNAEDYVAWSFQTNKKVTGTTNRNKAYTSHYNADSGFSIVGYEGDGVVGHEIPHHLGVVPELSIWKNRDQTDAWHTQGKYIGDASNGDYLNLDTTSAITNSASIHTIFGVDTIRLNTAAGQNAIAENIISYHFASVEGVSKVGKYIGTGAAGNYVDCGFKPAFVMYKRISDTGSWVVFDAMRGAGYLLPDLSNAEGSSAILEFVDDGFVITGVSDTVNGLNDEFLFLAFAETNIDATKAWTDFTYPTTADTLSIENNTVVSVANGFNASGQVDTQYQFTGGVTHALGAGYESLNLFVYTDKLGNIGTTEHRPLIGWGSRDDADKWGVESPLDKSLRTNARHFDYESETGVVLASAEEIPAWSAFDHTDSTWRVDTTGASWVQYKQTEARILKSWRMRSGSDVTESPRQFTIEGSDDGYTWTAIDSTYTSSDYTDIGSNLWGALQDTSANTTAYLYHRINITVNNGDAGRTRIAELEFNTILPADYYLVEDGKIL